MMALRVLGVLGGIIVVAFVLSAMVRTVVVPRDERVWLSVVVFDVTRLLFAPFAKESHTYERRDRIMARDAPTALLMLPVVWAFGIIGGFTPIFWGLGVKSWRTLGA